MTLDELDKEGCSSSTSLSGSDQHDEGHDAAVRDVSSSTAQVTNVAEAAEPLDDVVPVALVIESSTLPDALLITTTTTEQRAEFMTSENENQENWKKQESKGDNEETSNVAAATQPVELQLRSVEERQSVEHVSVKPQESAEQTSRQQQQQTFARVQEEEEESPEGSIVAEQGMTASPPREVLVNGGKNSPSTTTGAASVCSSKPDPPSVWDTVDQDRLALGRSSSSWQDDEDSKDGSVDNDDDDDDELLFCAGAMDQHEKRQQVLLSSSEEDEKKASETLQGGTSEFPTPRSVSYSRAENNMINKAVQEDLSPDPSVSTFEALDSSEHADPQDLVKPPAPGSSDDPNSPVTTSHSTKPSPEQNSSTSRSSSNNYDETNDNIHTQQFDTPPFPPPPPPLSVESSFLRGDPVSLQMLPSVDGHRLQMAPAPRVLLSSTSPVKPPQQLLPQHYQQPPQQHAFTTNYQTMPKLVTVASSAQGRRKIRLRLQEEVPRPMGLLGSIRRSSRQVFGHIRTNSSGWVDDVYDNDQQFVSFAAVNRGTIFISWYEGTGSLELHEHLRKTVIRKLKLVKPNELADLRVLDESVDPPEEIVLSPFIPDGSEFLLRFSLHDTSNDDGAKTPTSQYSSVRAPESPSAAPSPHLSRRDLLASLKANQVALLNVPTARSSMRRLDEKKPKEKTTSDKRGSQASATAPTKSNPPRISSKGSLSAMVSETKEKADEEDDYSNVLSVHSVGEEDEDDDMMMHSEDPIEARLREITEILLRDRRKKPSHHYEKRQVIFVLANYFVLFLSLIAISAEINSRAPGWLSNLELHMQNVQDCATDQEALFRCVSNGDFAGLVASVIIWLTRSVATKRIFLFGFETQQKLWTVVYESFVTAFCWGVSYIFIRRGLNPDTRSRFLQKYWKDAVYGSLAGFNASFLKQVLKNLIPQEAVEEAVQDALRERPLNFLRWLNLSLE